MADKKPDLTVDQELAATKEALRLQELDAAEREERLATLEAQQAKEAAAKPQASTLPTITYKKKKYRFVYAALRFGGGKKLTAEEIAEDDALVEQLITNGSAALVAV